MKPNGHGYVTPNENGLKARCGGPALCRICQQEARELPKAELICKRTETDKPGIVLVTMEFSGSKFGIISLYNDFGTPDGMRLIRQHFYLQKIEQEPIDPRYRDHWSAQFTDYIAFANHTKPLVIRLHQERREYIPTVLGKVYERAGAPQ